MLVADEVVGLALGDDPAQPGLRRRALARTGGEEGGPLAELGSDLREQHPGAAHPGRASARSGARPGGEDGGGGAQRGDRDLGGGFDGRDVQHVEAMPMAMGGTHLG